MLARIAIAVGVVGAAGLAVAGGNGLILFAMALLVTMLAFCDPQMRDRFHLGATGGAVRSARDNAVTGLIFLTGAYLVWLVLSAVFWPIRLAIQLL